MSKRNSTVKIVDGKVVFSEEVLSYFESIRTEENGVWIDKYFEYLGDESNLIATKYNLHHIRPCCTFKDEVHKNRKETLPLGDKFKGNIIKLSIYNHLLAHYCLWKIYDNWDSKNSIQKMCGQKQYIDNLTENELKEIAKLKEECVKENQTKEEAKQHKKEYYKNHKEEKKAYDKKRHEEHKEEISKQRKEHYENNKEEISKQHKKYRENNKEKISKQKKKWYEEHKEEIKEYWENNKEEISQRRKERYQNNREEILKRQREKRKNNKEKALEYERNWREKNKEKIHKSEKERDNRQCYDPKKENYCTYIALKCRKRRNKELYKDVILADCIIKNNEINA